MNKFTEHIPNFVDIDGSPTTITFESQEELLNDPFFDQYKKEKGFSHFAMNDRHLMQILDNGFTWWVVGYIEKPEEMNLPQWKGWKFRAELDGKEVILEGKDVVSACGYGLELIDGRLARNLGKP